MIECTNMKKHLLLSLSLLALATVFSPRAFAADSQCQPIYGGGQTCIQTGNVTIDKKVLKPGTKDFVDNLTVNDAKYVSEETVQFTLAVHNASTKDIANITVKDVIPQYLTFLSGDGAYDVNSRTFTANIASLKANETKTINLNARVVPQSELPSDSGVACVVNQGLVTFDGKTNQDNANLCIQKPTPIQSGPTPTQPGEPTTTTGKGGNGTQGQPTQTKGGQPIFPVPTTSKTPPTGPEMLALIGLLPIGALGQFLRKKSSK